MNSILNVFWRHSHVSGSESGLVFLLVDFIFLLMLPLSRDKRAYRHRHPSGSDALVVRGAEDA